LLSGDAGFAESEGLPGVDDPLPSDGSTVQAEKVKNKAVANKLIRIILVSFLMDLSPDDKSLVLV
jgi:hypothetical protein